MREPTAILFSDLRAMLAMGEDEARAALSQEGGESAPSMRASARAWLLARAARLAGATAHVAWRMVGVSRATLYRMYAAIDRERADGARAPNKGFPKDRRRQAPDASANLSSSRREVP
ncbi:MAG: hypothetical protein HY553_08655 [Elusimicrobia bacterium]|nr:hypothetical protein [Elusimicrobiota bacterium]